MGNREYIPYPRWGMDLVETLCIICSLLQGQINTSISTVLAVAAAATTCTWLLIPVLLLLPRYYY